MLLFLWNRIPEVRIQRLGDNVRLKKEKIREGKKKNVACDTSPKRGASEVGALSII